MSNFYKSVTDILKEAAFSDDFDSEDIELDELDIEAELDGMDELDEELIYNEEAIPVITNEAGQYFIEYDMLNKLMESKEIKASQAVELLVEYNGFPKGSTFVILDKLSSMKDQLRDLSDEQKTSVKDQLKDLKEAGIKVLAKKDKKKK